MIPLDFSDLKDVELLVESLQSFVKRKVPIRIGVVPTLRTAGATDQAKVVYHLLDTYGLGGLLHYLEGVRQPFMCLLMTEWYMLISCSHYMAGKHPRRTKPFSILPSRIASYVETNLPFLYRISLVRKPLQIGWTQIEGISPDSADKAKFHQSL